MIICYFNQCVVCQKKTVKKHDCTAFRIDFVPLRVHCLYRVHLATQDFTVIVKIQDLNFSLGIKSFATDRPRTLYNIFFISLTKIINRPIKYLETLCQHFVVSFWYEADMKKVKLPF